jgi:hypothetical protein
LLTAEEYASARASTPNAHFTSPLVISGIWNALERLGLRAGGQILEPSMGVGHFFGLMPDALTSGTRRTGVAFVASFGGSTFTGGFPNLVDDFGKPVGNIACCVLGGDDGIEWTSTPASVTGPLASDPNWNAAGLNPLYFTFEAPNANGVLNTSTTLPSPFPSLPGQWTDASFFCACGPAFSGTISSVSEVPEPGSGSLLLSVVGLIAFSRAYRRY